jgi:ABC-type dipeptide/oligopeptide/nickel transport system permease component
MAKLSSLVPPGLFRFVGGRLFRALVSLLLFQIILFSLIQALPDSHSAQSEGAAMAQALSQRRGSESQTEQEPDEGAEQVVPPPVIVRPPSAPDAEDLTALRESGQPEMIALLDEAMGEDKRVAQAEGTFIPTPAPVVVEAAAEEEAAAQEDLGSASEQSESEPEEATTAQQDGYEAGLRAIRPREKTVVEQFIDWMLNFVTGDLGESVVVGGASVLEILAEKLPETLLLFVPGTVGGLLLGYWLGKRVAWRQRGWVDFAATLGGTAFYTSFPPWLAFIVASIFAAYLRWVPPDGLRNPLKWVDADADFNRLLLGILLTFTLAIVASVFVVRLTRRMRWYRTWARIGGIAVVILLAITPWVTSELWPLGLDTLHHLALPLAALILLSFGETMLIMRATMAEAMQERFVTQVKAMGYSDARVRDRHVAPVAVLPVLTRFVVHLPFVIIGSFFLEQRFFIDGMGKELVRAANEFDLPVLMGVLSLVGIGILLAHVIFDVLTAWMDPRLRLARQSEAS